MFSPVGKKKYLLQIKRAKDATGVLPDISQFSPAKYNKNASRASSPRDLAETYANSFNKTAVKKENIVVGSTQFLETILEDYGVKGVVMNRILEATARYRPDRDADVLKAFQSKAIEYKNFRNYLHSVFWLTFTDVEFTAVVEIFGNDEGQAINGYDFMIAFIKLGTIRKDREASLVREKQEAYLKHLKDEEERKEFEKRKKMELSVSYDFAEDVKATVKEKLTLAAKNFDANHPAAPSLNSFEGLCMNAAEFRETLKRTFNLKLNANEVGAIMVDFDKNKEGTISSVDFLHHFMRLGFHAREKERVEQRERQLALHEGMKEEQRKKIEEVENKSNVQADYDYNEADEARAWEKVRLSSVKYDRNGPGGGQCLDGFAAESLAPGVFKGLVKSTFNLSLSNKELGVVAQRFTIAGTGAGAGRVNSTQFLGHFLRLGYEERHKKHLEQLNKQVMMITKNAEENLLKIKQVQEGGPSGGPVVANYDFSEEDLQAALKALTEASVRFDNGKNKKLECFEPQALSPLDFKRALKGTFNVKLSPKELGALVCTFDKEGTGQINCYQFLVSFLSLGNGERNALRLEQFKTNREGERLLRLEQENKLQAQTSRARAEVQVDYDFTDEDRDTALAKLTATATKYDKNHPSAMSLDGFECKSMPASAFKELVRRTFNLKLKPKEVGALVRHFAFQGAETKNRDEIDCSEFLTMFLLLGYSERAKVHSNQLIKQRNENKIREEENRKKTLELENRTDYIVDKDFTDADIQSAMDKIGNAAEGFDRYHPAAPSLKPFECAAMPAGLFRENLKNVFRIYCNTKEIGYLMSIFDINRDGKINCGEFMTKFFSIGRKRRYEKHAIFLTKQRNAIKASKLESENKLLAQLDRAELKIPLDFLEGQNFEEQNSKNKNFEGQNFEKEKKSFFYSPDDLHAAVEKLLPAAMKFDKYHPAAPSLEAFQRGPLKIGEFKEVVKATFNVYLNVKEAAAIVLEYAPFNKAAENYILNSNLKSNSSSSGIMNNSNETNLNNDKNINESNNKNTNVIYRNEKEKERKPLLDPKKFMNKFIKLGFDERARVKVELLEKQRANEFLREQESIRKKRLAEQKMELEIDETFGEVDRSNAYDKMKVASARYDRNSPGCVSLEAFDAKVMNAAMFREGMKRTFNVVFTPRELAAVMQDFMHESDDGDFEGMKGGGLVCSNFLKVFMRLGQEERGRMKMLQLEKSRESDMNKKTWHERKMREAEEKFHAAFMPDFTYGPQDRSAAFEKLVAAARRHERGGGLEGFQAAFMRPVDFREMCRRMFHVVFTPRELGAMVDYFAYKDEEGNGEGDKGKGAKLVNSRDFVVHFIKTGVAERGKEHTASLHKARQYAAQRTREEQEALAAQWGDRDTAYCNTEDQYSAEDLRTAGDKLLHAAFAFDPTSSSSSAGIAAFQAKTMAPVMFREMIRRNFNIKVTDKELAALIDEYGNENKEIVCADFMIKFTKMGLQRRDAMRLAQLEKNRRDEENIHRELAVKQKAALDKTEVLVDESFTRDDFNSALEKTRKIAGSYDRGHPSSPSLQGFMGADMTAAEFRDMMMRTFQVVFTPRELGALVKFFDSDGNNRIDSQEFLAHFFRLQRTEQSKVRREKIVTRRQNIAKQREDQASMDRRSQDEETHRLLFNETDESSFLSKLRQATERYAVDTASFTEPLQGFKGPAWSPLSFRDIFHRIFLVRFTSPELGVLLSVLDPGSTGNTIDGPRFLNWFYKLARLEERIMFGEVEDVLTMDYIRSNSSDPLKAMEPLNNSSSIKKKKEKSTVSKSTVSNRFASSTMSQSWLLPSLTRKGDDDDDDGDDALDLTQLQRILMSDNNTAPSPSSSSPMGHGDDDDRVTKPKPLPKAKAKANKSVPLSRSLVLAPMMMMMTRSGNGDDDDANTAPAPASAAFDTDILFNTSTSNTKDINKDKDKDKKASFTTGEIINSINKINNSKSYSKQEKENDKEKAKAGSSKLANFKISDFPGFRKQPQPVSSTSTITGPVSDETAIPVPVPVPAAGSTTKPKTPTDQTNTNTHNHKHKIDKKLSVINNNNNNINPVAAGGFFFFPSLLFGGEQSNNINNIIDAVEGEGENETAYLN